MCKLICVKCLFHTQKSHALCQLKIRSNKIYRHSINQSISPHILSSCVINTRVALINWYYWLAYKQTPIHIVVWGVVGWWTATTTSTRFFSPYFLQCHCYTFQLLLNESFIHYSRCINNSVWLVRFPPRHKRRLFCVFAHTFVCFFFICSSVRT